MGGLNWLALLVLASFVLLFDAAVLARHLGILRFPGELDSNDLARLGALGFLDSIEEMISRAEPGVSAGLAEPLAQSKASLSAARTREEVGRRLSHASSLVQSTVASERARLARERVSEILSGEPRLSRFRGSRAYILITISGGAVSVQDRSGVLSRATVEALRSDPAISRCPEPIEIRITDGGFSLEALAPETAIRVLVQDIANLNSEIASLRVEAGLAELSGPGVVVLAHDAPSGYAWDEIVHQKDVLDIIHALFGAGAQGVQVGNERIVATSSVRCVGPIVLVNNRPVPVNPIRITAVGDRAALARGLAPTAASFARTGKKLEVKPEPEVRLTSYRKGDLRF